jgi:2-polyprenyl-3-methyl-5-hydroxy-6-metoxy-1,4-benzoquinol methylase
LWRELKESGYTARKDAATHFHYNFGAIVERQVKLLRHGKPSGPLLQLKSSFFQENSDLQANVERLCHLYARQPLRKACKNCGHPLAGRSFTKLSVRYILCDRCGHLNGAHEDSDEFCRAVYTDDSGKSYAKTYDAADEEAYQERVAAIYRPKAHFLREVLHAAGENCEYLRFADLGAGSGYFVDGLLHAGMRNAVGYEVGEAQIQLARRMVKGAEFRQHALEEVISIAETADAEVISMIGVLEHVQDPRGLLTALQRNPTVKYLYFSLPMFSTTVYLEAVFPNVFHRQLSAGHTHLYTESSLAWLAGEFGLESIGEWWFGTDMVDLLRDVQVSLAANPQTSELVETWRQSFIPLVDTLQLEIDRQRKSSEIHVVFKKTPSRKTPEQVAEIETHSYRSASAGKMRAADHDG